MSWVPNVQSWLSQGDDANTGKAELEENSESLDKDEVEKVVLFPPPLRFSSLSLISLLPFSLDFVIHLACYVFSFPFFSPIPFSFLSLLISVPF